MDKPSEAVEKREGDPRFDPGIRMHTPKPPEICGCSQSEALKAEAEVYRKALERICNELGVPGPGYPQPVANAVDIARAALNAVRS